MSLLLPDLLIALAEIFAHPSAFPKATLVAATEAFWVSDSLKAHLNSQLGSETGDLAVAYADHFLMSRAHPLLYLEASVHRMGLLRDPALLHDLDQYYEACGFNVPQGLAPDHLSTELEALAVGLQRLALASGRDLARIVPHLLGLIDLHLLPLLSKLNELARKRPMHSAYATSLEAASSCVELAREGLFACNS